MARSVPPHQPSFGGRASEDGHSDDARSADPVSGDPAVGGSAPADAVSPEDRRAAVDPDGRDARGEALPRDGAADARRRGDRSARTAPGSSHQGELGSEGDPDWDADWGVGPGEEFHGVEDEPPVVRVNDGAKVTRVDTGQLEAAPAAGGRFSTWRARRRAARAEEAAAGSTGEPGDDAGEHSDSTVLQFPPSTHRRRRRRRLTTLLVSLGVLVLLALVVFFSPLFATRTIDVEGARLTDPDAVQEALSGFQGVPLTRISKQDVKDSLGDVPQVKSVDVVFHPPHTIAVQLHERVGVAVVEDGDSLVLVDSEGKPLSTVAKAQRPDVPLVSGGRGVLSTQKFTDVSEVLAALPADVLSELESAAAPSGSAVELTFKDGRKVLWGDASQSELKAQVIAALVNSQATADATEIDVSAPLHPVVT